MGKTFLANAIGEILPDCAVVKLGSHHARPEKNQLYFERGTPYSKILEKTSQRSYLVIESGSILEDPDLSADLVIYLPGVDGDKPGSESRRAAAHLIRGSASSSESILTFASRLGVDRVIVQKIVDYIESFVPSGDGRA